MKQYIYIIFNNILYNLINLEEQMSEMRELDGGYKAEAFWMSG